MADELIAIANVVGLVITMRGEDGQDGGVGGRDKLDPVARRHVEALGRRRQHPFPLGFSVISGDPERPRHGDKELVACLVGVSAAGDPGTQVEEMEFPTDLERQLLAGFSESKGPSLVTTGRQVEQYAGSVHRGPAMSDFRYTP